MDDPYAWAGWMFVGLVAVLICVAVLVALWVGSVLGSLFAAVVPL